MNSNGFFSLIVCLVISVIVKAQAPGVIVAENANEPTDLFYLCKNSKSNTRWLRAYRLEGGKCHAVYSKEGYLQIISSATYWSSCEGVLHNVRKNIEEGGYKCTKLDSYSYIEIE